VPHFGPDLLQVGHLSCISDVIRNIVTSWLQTGAALALVTIQERETRQPDRET